MARGMTKAKPGIAAAAACALLVAGCCSPAWADDAETVARELADEVLGRKIEDGDELGPWARSTIDRALERAGKDAAEAVNAGDAPLAGERHAASVAAGPAGREASAEILVFMSLAVPPESWAQWARDAARFGAPLLLRGAGEAGLRATVEEAGRRLGGFEAGVAIDPRLFRLFGVERVPAVVAAPGGVPACASRGCADDAPPPHDLVIGNVGLAAALETIAAEGDAGREAARRTLARPRGARE